MVGTGWRVEEVDSGVSAGCRPYQRANDDHSLKHAPLGLAARQERRDQGGDGDGTSESNKAREGVGHALNFSSFFCKGEWTQPSVCWANHHPAVLSNLERTPVASTASQM